MYIIKRHFHENQTEKKMKAGSHGKHKVFVQETKLQLIQSGSRRTTWWIQNKEWKIYMSSATYFKHKKHHYGRMRVKDAITNTIRNYTCIHI